MIELWSFGGWVILETTAANKLKQVFLDWCLLLPDKRLRARPPSDGNAAPFLYRDSNGYVIDLSPAGKDEAEERI